MSELDNEEENEKNEKYIDKLKRGTLAQRWKTIEYSRIERRRSFKS